MVATKAAKTPTKTTKTAKTATPEIEREPQVKTTPVEATSEVEGVQAQRAALKVAGYKRCPAHLTYLDRLPAEAQQPVVGYESDVSIRPLTEFGTMSACKACLKVRNAEKRVVARGDAPTRDLQRLVRLTHKYEAMRVEIERLTATLSPFEQQELERLVQQA